MGYRNRKPIRFARAPAHAVRMHLHTVEILAGNWPEISSNIPISGQSTGY